MLQKARSKQLPKVITLSLRTISSAFMIGTNASSKIGKMAPPTTAGHPHKNVSSSSKKARMNANAHKRKLKRKSVIEDVKFFSTSSGGG